MNAPVNVAPFNGAPVTRLQFCHTRGPRGRNRRGSPGGSRGTDRQHLPSALLGRLARCPGGPPSPRTRTIWTQGKGEKVSIKHFVVAITRFLPTPSLTMTFGGLAGTHAHEFHAESCPRLFSSAVPPRAGRGVLPPRRSDRSTLAGGCSRRG